MSQRRLPPMPPEEPANGRSCDGGHCDNPSIGWRWYPDIQTWLPVCNAHMRRKGVPPEFKAIDPDPT